MAEFVCKLVAGRVKGLPDSWLRDGRTVGDPRWASRYPTRAEAIAAGNAYNAAGGYDGGWKATAAPAPRGPMRG